MRLEYMAGQVPGSAPSAKHLREAEDYVKAWCRSSAEYVQRKLKLWSLLEDLYWNRRALSEWDQSRLATSTKPAASRLDLLGGTKHDNTPPWRADYTLPVSSYVDTYAQAVLQVVFASDDFFTVEPRPQSPQSIQAEMSVEDPQYPTSKKLETFLIDTCNTLRFRTRVHEYIADSATYGTGVAKVVWLQESEDIQAEDDYGNPIFDPISGKPVIIQRPIVQGAGIRVINLARFLPDPLASDSNVQLWSGVGDWTLVPWRTLSSRFSTGTQVGPYAYGRSEFFSRWPEEGSHVQGIEPLAIKDDPHAYDQSTPESRTFLKVWEWHGKIHFSDEPRAKECCTTIVTDATADNPANGVLVRFQEEPVLKVGLRTYLVSHFIPQAGPFGMGLIERNLPIIWTLSHAINQFVDAIRLVSTPMLAARRHGSIYSQIQDDPQGGTSYPGKIFWCDDDPAKEVMPFSLSVPHLDALLKLIDYLTGLLDRSTSVPNISGGIGGRASATEAKGVFDAINRPIGQVLAELKENFLEPYARLALAYFQRMVAGPQTVWVKSPTGVPIPVELTEDEIRTGEYTAKASLDTLDSAKISKAQTLQQLIPMFAQIGQPLLQFENTVISYRKIVERILQNLDVSDVSDFLKLVDEDTKMQMLGPPPGAAPPGAPPGNGAPGEGQGNPEAPGGPVPSMPEDIPPEIMQQILSQMQAPGMNGGPMGGESSPLNDILARLQMDAQNSGPVIPGSQYPG